MGLTIVMVFVVSAVYVQNRGALHHQKITRKLSDHANFLAPINCLFYLFNKGKNTPYVDVSRFPELEPLKANWEIIREEALHLNDEAQIKASSGYDDLGFNSFFRKGWKRFYLKWYGASLPSAERLCPRTLALINRIGSVKGAMFTMLPPGAELNRHRDPYAGSFRYHLGLVTPNSDDCYICVDGQAYSWRDGEPVMFDETYIHYAKNHTDHNRIILFLDVKRPVRFFLVDWINEVFSRVVMSASATKNLDGDRVGLLNRLFGTLYGVRLLGKKLKAFNKTLYYLLQYGLYLALIGWLVWSL